MPAAVKARRYREPKSEIKPKTPPPAARHTPRNRDATKVNQIIDAACRAFQMRRSELLAKRRTDYLVKRRQAVMYLAKLYTIASFPTIGKALGGIHHTTVIYGAELVEDNLEAFAAYLEAIERELGRD